jgi:transcriptional regulator with GAF, ATPase, and Fis domain
MAGAFDAGDASTRDARAEDVFRVQLQGASVEVVEGADAGLSVPLLASGALIGSGVACDVRLADPLVSRRHLQLHAEAHGVRVIDLGSRNGTFMAGVRIGEVTLAQDAMLSIGDTTLAVRIGRDLLDLALSPRSRFGEAIGHSEAMRHVFTLLEHAAQTDATVLLEGESGTGKDVLATSLHQKSARHEAPFVVVDCGAIPANLVESELFGHERGAFSGAIATRLGAFELAQGGTVFLDEIGELPLELQPKLLRVLESKSFRRLGGTRVIEVDVRVVAATSRCLREAVRSREFREDLYYRLAVILVRVPPLAHRREDVLPLAEAFLRRTTGRDDVQIPEDLARLLHAYSWPGNARELRNVVDRFATFQSADVKLLFGEHKDSAASASFVPVGIEQLPYHEAKRRLMDHFHRTIITRALERAGGSVPKAAELLGLPKTSVYRMLQNLRDETGEGG